MPGRKTHRTKIDIPALQLHGGIVRFPLPFPEVHETDPEKMQSALIERIKELNCMYAMAILAERHSDSIEDFLQNLVEIIPPSWQYPEIARARIIFEGTTCKSREFKSSRWRLSSRIHMYNEPVGEVEVFYSEEAPPEDEGPFLREERLLLDAIAEQIGKTAIRIYAEQELKELNKQLTVERESLKEANVALKTVMEKIKEEKAEISRSVQANVEKIITPVIHALSLDLPPNKMKYIDILQSSLDEITSPFIDKLSRKFYSLTPTEIKICKLIREGLRTKEIAQIHGVSSATINRHREHIRKKLEITNKDINLTTYLQSNIYDE